MATRAYSSPLRAEQAAQTRARLLDAARDVATREGADALTLPRLAEAAGVSVPTVYRHFATPADLYAALIDAVRPQLGMTPERLLGGGVDDVATLADDNYPRFERHAAYLKALMDSPAWNRARVASVAQRAPRGAAVLRAIAPDWSDAELEAAAGAIWSVGSPHTWRWLRETWGLDAARTRRAAAWAMRALIAAVQDGAGLDDAPSTTRTVPSEVTTTRRTKRRTKGART